MDMARAFVGFVLGLVVMGAVVASGALDGAVHWWARNVTHRGDANYDFDPEHARYTVTTLYRPDDSSRPGCEPRYIFVNHTNRVVKFLPDGYDDSSYGDQGSYSPPGSKYVSTTPEQGGPVPPSKPGAPGYDAQTYGPSNYDQQTYGPPSSGQQGHDQQSYGGSQGYNDQDYDSGQEYDGSSHDDQYDDDYPGPGNGGECNTGVVKIILDRKK
jgi:hypothetical protein